MTIPLTLLSFFFVHAHRGGGSAGTVRQCAGAAADRPVLHLGHPGHPAAGAAVHHLYGLPSVGIMLDAFPAAVIAFAFNEGAYCAETMRGALESVPQGQLEAGYCVGMSWWQIMRRIVLPQALRTAVARASSEPTSYLPSVRTYVRNVTVTVPYRTVRTVPYVTVPLRYGTVRYGTYVRTVRSVRVRGTGTGTGPSDRTRTVTVTRYRYLTVYRYRLPLRLPVTVR